MSGLRERKRRKTFKTIHDAGMRLFGERGYAAVTVGDIAEAAEVSRATVFAYYPAKEDIVLGDAPMAIESLKAALAGDGAVVDKVRDWLRTLVGWMEPDVVLQRRLAHEIPAVSAARSRLAREIEDQIAEAFERELGAGGRLAARLAAGSLASALDAVEQEGAARMASSGQALAAVETDALLDAAVAFVQGGLGMVVPDAVGKST